MKIVLKLNFSTTEHAPLSGKIQFSLQNPWLSTWLPLFSIVQPLASPWLRIAGSQKEAKDKKLMKIVSKLNTSTTEHAPLSVKI